MNDQRPDTLTVWGERIALAAAVALTAKGEFDLAVLTHFAPGIAWIYPVMLDVYVITAFHKRRRTDMMVALGLMLFSQVSVHLVPVFVPAGDPVPWWLVMAVACIAPVVVVRVKMLTGKTAAEREAEEVARRKAEELAAARARAEEADRKRAEAEAAFRAEERNRKAAEERAEAERTAREVAEAEMVRDAEEREEADRKARAEISRLTRHAEEVQASARGARAQAAEQSELAARISGQLDEARLTAERAITEKMATEQHLAVLTESRQAVAEELAKARQVIARLQQRAEAEGRKPRTVSASSGRKKSPALPAASASALPPVLPDDLPPVEGVSAATVARVISAYRNNPGANQKELEAASGISDRTVRKVLAGIPADHPALAIEAGTEDIDRVAV